MQFKTMAALGLGLWLAACSSIRQTPLPYRKPLTQLFSVNRYSDTEPCGCSFSPWGGLTREWNFLEQERKSSEPLYLISGTSFVPEGSNFHSSRQTLYLYKAGSIMEAFKEFKVSALSPSAEDLFIGVDGLKAHSAKWDVPLVSSNLFDRNGRLLFAPYLKIEHQGVPLLVLGLSGKPRKDFPRLKKIKVGPPVEALKTLLSTVAPGRLIILLSSLSKEQMLEVIDAFPQINIISGGANDEYPSKVNQYTGSALYVNSQGNGQTLMRLDLEVCTPIRTLYNSDSALAHQQTREIWKSNLYEAEKKIKSSSEPKEKQSYQAEKKQFELFLKRSQSVELQPSDTSTLYRYSLIKLNTEYDGGPNPMHSLLERMHAGVRQLAIDEKLDR
ncbi:MAG: hypothetical protein HY537_18580 [Deltaproteobacteria bacterium]|nr:hypothetical protein [Deltaproteobacteria bacterium]